MTTKFEQLPNYTKEHEAHLQVTALAERTAKQFATARTASEILAAFPELDEMMKSDLVDIQNLASEYAEENHPKHTVEILMETAVKFGVWYGGALSRALEVKSSANVA